MKLKNLLTIIALISLAGCSGISRAERDDNYWWARKMMTNSLPPEQRAMAQFQLDRDRWTEQQNRLLRQTIWQAGQDAKQDTPIPYTDPLMLYRMKGQL